jgi:hypothetical protein
MVTLRPAANGASRRLERFEPSFVDARLGVHELADGVDATTIDSGLRLEPFVEDPRRHGDESAAQPRAAGGAEREHEPRIVEHDGRRHHARHAFARLERAEEQVDLAEHAVQMQVEAR